MKRYDVVKCWEESVTWTLDDESWDDMMPKSEIVKSFYNQQKAESYLRNYCKDYQGYTKAGNFTTYHYSIQTIYTGVM